MILFNNKKAQYAQMRVNSTSSINRQKRKTHARALTNLGFSINELVNYLGVSSNTIKTYLRETEGTTYTDLLEFSLKYEVRPLFTKDEQEFLIFFKEFTRKAERLSKLSKLTENLAKGKGICGFIVKNIFKSCEKYEKRHEQVNKEIRELAKEGKNRIKQVADNNKYPHLSKCQSAFIIEIKES